MDLREMKCGLLSSGSGYGPMADSCECGNEASGSIKRGGFFIWLSKLYIFEKNFAPFSYNKTLLKLVPHIKMCPLMIYHVV
jgi:hypothetical protein